MNKSIKTALFTVAVVGFNIFPISCEKAEPAQVACLVIVVPDTLRFNLVDKDTKENLFLSENPKYELDQLQLFAKKAGKDELQAIEYYISEEQSHIFTYVTAGNGNNIIYLQIGEQRMDEITLTFKLVKQLGCPYHFLDQVTFNNEASEKNAHGRVVPFYRDE